MRLLVGWGSLYAVACMVLASGCAKPSIKIDGSSTVQRISQAVGEEFKKAQPNTRIMVGKSGTGGGFKKFAAGEINICNASRPITPIEREACAKNDVEFVELEIASDGLTVAVNPKNDWCDCLTVEQLKAIWQPQSAVSRWSDLNPAWPDEEIRLYGPGTDSGTFDFFTKEIVGQEGKSRADYSPSEDDNSLVTGVAGDMHALGYFGLAYYEQNRDRLKALGVDAGDGNCVKPSAETVRNETYKPLSRPLYIYVSKSSLSRPDMREFVKFYLENVSRLVSVVGYVPLPEDVLEESMQTLEETLAAVPVAEKA